MATAITCLALLNRELPGDAPFLFPIDAQAKLGLIKDMARSRIFIENKPGFYLRMYKDAKTGGFRFAERSGVDASAVEGIQTHVRPGSDNTTSDLPHWWNEC